MTNEILQHKNQSFTRTVGLQYLVCLTVFKRVCFKMHFRILFLFVLCGGLGETYANPNLKLSRSKRQRTECTPRGNAQTTSMCDQVIPIPETLRQELNLDDFYHNYTHAYGIPILSSGAVSKEAMQRACYTVRFMLTDRLDIRNEMHNYCARVSIIGIEELTNQIPEYSYFDDAENTRSRGIGGTLNNPVTTAAEENLLCQNWTSDRWWQEDIMVHEFAHAVHKIGWKKVDSGFNKRLKDTYNTAVGAGLWSMTYAGYNPTEYFAEGVQKFFDVDVVQSFTDGVHNHIGNRSQLLDYDPELYGLALETFPCANTIVSRCEDQSLIYTQTLNMDCNDMSRVEPTTTKVQTTVHVNPPTTEPTTTKVSTTVHVNPTTASTSDDEKNFWTEPGCYDNYKACAVYASKCSHSIIKRVCRSTCNMCDKCVDFYPSSCEKWKNEGLCETERTFMYSNCRETCKQC